MWYIAYTLVKLLVNNSIVAIKTSVTSNISVVGGSPAFEFGVQETLRRETRTKLSLPKKSQKPKIYFSLPVLLFGRSWKGFCGEFFFNLHYAFTPLSSFGSSSYEYDSRDHQLLSEAKIVINVMPSPIKITGGPKRDRFCTADRTSRQRGRRK